MQTLYDFIASNFVPAVIAGLVAAYIFIWLRGWINAPWSLRRKRMFNPGQRGAKDLGYTIKVLGNINSWLETNRYYFKEQIEESLWHLINYLKVAQLTYLAIHSKKMEEQTWNVRQISQMGETMAREALETIIVEVSSPEKEAVRVLAQQCLREVAEPRFLTDTHPPPPPKE